jgi:hypothetical protein
MQPKLPCACANTAQWTHNYSFETFLTSAGSFVRMRRYVLQCTCCERFAFLLHLAQPGHVRQLLKANPTSLKGAHGVRRRMAYQVCFAWRHLQYAGTLVWRYSRVSGSPTAGSLGILPQGQTCSPATRLHNHSQACGSNRIHYQSQAIRARRQCWNTGGPPRHVCGSRMQLQHLLMTPCRIHYVSC